MKTSIIFDKMAFMKNTGFAKKFLFVSVALLASLNLFALPGVQSPVPDTSGEYVYYRDYSFNRESYIGFLYYDDSTYEARYYAPETESLAAKNIDMLFTVDPNKDRLELTGERFVAPPQQDDIEIVNYIHDLLYELGARRAKLQESVLVDYAKSKGPFMETGTKVSEDYEQFGGPVQILYDAAVPIFNLKKIVDYSGRDVFVVVTIGQLESSKDKSFAEFVPPIQNASKRAPKEVKSAKKETMTFRVEIGKKSVLLQAFSADKNWSLAGQSVWTLGDAAIASLQSMALPEDVLFGKEETAARLLRLFASSKNHAYSDWTALDIHADASRIKISSRTYNPKTQKVITDIKTLGAAATNLYGCFSLAVYTDDYQANRGYFDKMAKSYVCKME